MTIAEGDARDALGPDSIAEFASELSQAAEEALPALGEGSGSIATKRSESVGDDTRKLQSILKIPVTMKIVVGAVTLPVSELRALKTGHLLTLDRKVGEAVDVVVNGQILARGILVIADQSTSQLGVQLTELAGVSKPRNVLPIERT